MECWSYGIIRRAGVIAVLLTAGAGCLRLEPDLQSADPVLRIPAMQEAARDGGNDPQVLERLVAGLDNDDAAIRFYAIESLERLTSQTFGYRYYDGAEARKSSVRQWQQWLDGSAGATAAGDLRSQ